LLWPYPACQTASPLSAVTFAIFGLTNLDRALARSLTHSLTLSLSHLLARAAQAFQRASTNTSCSTRTTTPSKESNSRMHSVSRSTRRSMAPLRAAVSPSRKRRPARCSPPWPPPLRCRRSLLVLSLHGTRSSNCGRSWPVASTASYPPAPPVRCPRSRPPRLHRGGARLVAKNES
jgi:hypothetical protein